MRRFIKKTGTYKLVPGIVHRTPIAERDSGFRNREFQAEIRNAERGKIQGVYGSGSRNTDARAGVQRSDGRGSGAMPPGNQVALGIEAGEESVNRRRAIEIVADVVLARPNDLHRRAGFPGDEGGFDGVILNEAAAKTTADERDVDFDVLARNAECAGDRFRGCSGDLRWRPKFAGIAANVGSAIDRLHRGMSEKGNFVDCLDFFVGSRVGFVEVA